MEMGRTQLRARVMARTDESRIWNVQGPNMGRGYGSKKKPGAEIQRGCLIPSYGSVHSSFIYA